jgi:hypothetical protein
MLESLSICLYSSLCLVISSWLVILVAEPELEPEPEEP